jgi:hypothetical protein
MERAALPLPTMYVKLYSLKKYADVVLSYALRKTVI